MSSSTLLLGRCTLRNHVDLHSSIYGEVEIGTVFNVQHGPAARTMSCSEVAPECTFELNDQLVHAMGLRGQQQIKNRRI